MAKASTGKPFAVGGARGRETSILDTLVRRVRILSVAQTARTWWPDSVHSVLMAERHVAKLVERQQVERSILFARPEIMLSAPLATWSSGQPMPNFRSLANRLTTRWATAGPVRATPCIRASVGVGRPSRHTEVTHDLHLSQVYLSMMVSCAERANTWVFESELAQPDQKLPDAMVRDGICKTAIELGGQYNREKLAAFHVHCQERGYGYEIW